MITIWIKCFQCTFQHQWVVYDTTQCRQCVSRCECLQRIR